MRRAMHSLATVAYCALTLCRADGLRPDSHPTLLSHNRSSEATMRCIDRSSTGCERAERVDVSQTDLIARLPLDCRPLPGENRATLRGLLKTQIPRSASRKKSR